MANVLFQVRGTQLPAYFSTSGADYYGIETNSNADPAPAVTALADASVFGGFGIDLKGAGKGIYYQGAKNFSLNQAFAFILRIVPKWTGVPAADVGLLTFGVGGLTPQLVGYVNGAGGIGKITFILKAPWGGQIFNVTSAAGLSFTTGVATDICLSWDGTTTASAVKCSQDGAVVATATGAIANSYSLPQMYPGLFFGYAAGDAALNNHYINEFVAYDGAQSPTYSVRTGFVTATNVDCTVSTGAGAGNIKAGFSETINGTVVNGTYTPVWTAASNVRSGTDRGDGTLGTCVVPVAANVLSGVAVDATVGTYSGASKADIAQLKALILSG